MCCTACSIIAKAQAPNNQHIFMVYPLLNRLKEILNILDTDVKQTKPKTEHMQKIGKIKKPEDIDKDKKSDKTPKKEDKEKANNDNNVDEPKVKVDDPQKF